MQSSYLTFNFSHFDGIKLLLSAGLLVTGCCMVSCEKKSIQGCNAGHGYIKVTFTFDKFHQIFGMYTKALLHQN